MKILFDECVPRILRQHLTGHRCTTVSEAGFAGTENGELLSLAEGRGYEVFLTVDQGIEHQQNPAGRKISVIILRARRNSLRYLLPLVPAAWLLLV